VRRGDEHLLVTRGEAESILAICQSVTIDGSPQPFDDRHRAQAAETLPYTPVGSLLRFIPLPMSMWGAIAFIVATYLLVVQLVKSWFYRRHALL